MMATDGHRSKTGGRSVVGRRLILLEARERKDDVVSRSGVQLSRRPCCEVAATSLLKTAGVLMHQSLMGCLHDPANVQQTSSRCIQNTPANAHGRLLDRVNTPLVGRYIHLTTAGKLDTHCRTRTSARYRTMDIIGACLLTDQFTSNQYDKSYSLSAAKIHCQMPNSVTEAIDTKNPIDCNAQAPQ